MFDLRDDIKIRCKKCFSEHYFSTLKNGVCTNCLKKYSHNCGVCKTPISDQEYKARQGFCKECQWTWLRSEENKIIDNVEVYPGTGF